MSLRLFVTLLVMAPLAIARAGDCYYYWSHQCVEVLDASKRQLRQTVLMSPSINYFNSGAQSCDTAANSRQEPVAAKLLEAFNSTAEKVRACNAPLSQVSLRVFENPQKATWHYNRATRTADNKSVLTVDNLPFL